MLKLPKKIYQKDQGKDGGLQGVKALGFELTGLLKFP